MIRSSQVQEIETADSPVHSATSASCSELHVALLTGGADKPYAFGLATALIAKSVVLDLVANDELDLPEFRDKPNVNFLNLRGDQRPNVSKARKLVRVLLYYLKLIRYAARSKPKIFHILWNNKFEAFDRTVLILFYMSLGKKIVLTVHNVNAGKRDSTDTLLNRLTLRVQYRLADHLFVHTEAMKSELMSSFGVQARRISVIPFGINNAVPNTALSPREARQRLSIRESERVILFFGHITPYKGLEYLVEAFNLLVRDDNNYRLIITGRPKNCESYWKPIQESIQKHVQSGKVLLRADHIPDDEIELYFKAADALALPYKHVYQSGVLFLAYSFGLPVLAADVGNLKDEVLEGETGFIFKPDDPFDLAQTITRYYASGLFANLSSQRTKIHNFAIHQHSWELVAETTTNVYSGLLRTTAQMGIPDPQSGTAPLDSKTSVGADRAERRA
jgi:glycosyltransferase involved in cell wall biosynthesis